MLRPAGNLRVCGSDMEEVFSYARWRGLVGKEEEIRAIASKMARYSMLVSSSYIPSSNFVKTLRTHVKI